MIITKYFMNYLDKECLTIYWPNKHSSTDPLMRIQMNESKQSHARTQEECEDCKENFNMKQSHIPIVSIKEENYQKNYIGILANRTNRKNLEKILRRRSKIANKINGWLLQIVLYIL